MLEWRKAFLAEGIACAKVLRQHLSMEETASQKLGFWGTPRGQGGTRIDRIAEHRKTAWKVGPRRLGFTHGDKSFGTERAKHVLETRPGWDSGVATRTKA